MASDKIDYKTECLAYLKLLDSGVQVTQQSYCERRSQETGLNLSFSYFRKTLSRLREQKRNKAPKTKRSGGRVPPAAQEQIDWAPIKAAYLARRFETLTDVAAHVGMSPGTSAFRKAVAGWNKERSSLKAPPPPLEKALDMLAQQRAADKIRDIFAEALAVHYQVLDVVKRSAKNSGSWKDPDKTPWHSHMAIQFSIDTVKAMKEILPAIKGLESLQSIHKIFDGLQDGSMDLPHAAIEFARLGVTLPKPIEILLTRYKPEEELPDAGDEITDEMIMARRAELLAEIETERVEFVRERKRVVASLKEETAGADSFAAQAREERGTEAP